MTTDRIATVNAMKPASLPIVSPLLISDLVDEERA
jgi:hypothetical protein